MKASLALSIAYLPGPVFVIRSSWRRAVSGAVDYGAPANEARRLAIVPADNGTGALPQSLSTRAKTLSTSDESFYALVTNAPLEGEFALLIHDRTPGRG